MLWKMISADLKTNVKQEIKELGGCIFGGWLIMG